MTNGFEDIDLAIGTELPKQAPHSLSGVGVCLTLSYCHYPTVAGACY